MKKLINAIQQLKNSDIKSRINTRIIEFKKINKHSDDDLFKELCFCILTANFNAERGIQIHQQLCDCFSSDTQEVLEKKLKASGYRFPHTRAGYITDTALKKKSIQTAILSLNKEKRREWLVENIKGLGYKEASHFLRNIGFDNYAIIDSHILDILQRYRIIKPIKTLTKKNYLKIEKVLQRIAHKTDLTLATLDLYLWYMETGKILK
jgi:N-glycosylase/DNA lyase